MTTIGKRIKQRREELRMTQLELAKKMGYSSKTTICKVESGINDITQSVVIKYAEALDTTVGYLMGWEDNLNEETGAWLADSLEDVELITYMKKIQQASPEVRAKILSMIDIMLSE